MAVKVNTKGAQILFELLCYHATKPLTGLSPKLTGAVVPQIALDICCGTGAIAQVS
jgi:hypothetical protein